MSNSRESVVYQPLSTRSESSLSDSPVVVEVLEAIEPKMNESKYSKVIFSEISESYATDADIECRFYIGDAVVPSGSDKIGLFRVGWLNAAECLVVKNASESETDNDFGEKKVRFDASQLPKHTEEFFQFCYLTTNDDICGASTPFRFVRPHEEDLIQLDNKNEDEEDFVVVRSQQALLQERLQHLVNENGVLEYSKRSLDQQIVSKTAEANELRKLNVELEDRIKLLELDSNRVMDKLKSSEEQSSSKCNRIEALELELAEMKKMKNDCDYQLESTHTELMRLLELNKRFEFRDTEKEQLLKSRDQEVMDLIKKVAEQQVRIEELSSAKAMVEAKLELSSTSIAKVMSERRDFDSENKMLRNELLDTKAKCDSLESKTSLMMDEIKDFDKIQLKSKVQMRTMVEEMDDLKQKLLEAETTPKRMSAEWKAKEEELENQLQEMKLRLSDAFKEYQKVCAYNEKLEKRIDKIKAKVRKYFDTKSQTRAATDVSPTERQELISRAETEVKTVIETEVESNLSAVQCTAPEERTESIHLSQMPCIICNEEITCLSRDSKAMLQHLEDTHRQLLCPVCSMPFDKTLSGHRNYFEMHVENHFNPQYPQPSASAPMIP